MIGVLSVYLNHEAFFDTRLTDLLIGAFVAAPIGGLLWGFGAFALRIGFHWILAKLKGRRFNALDKPPQRDFSSFGRREPSLDDDRHNVDDNSRPTTKGKFF